MGKKRIAQVLAKAGLTLGTTTIGRMLKAPRSSPPDGKGGSQEQTCFSEESSSTPTITARYPDHVWHVDLTAVPTCSGFWVPWIPFALPQVWPFCWWVGVVLDHFSRRVVGFRIFRTPPPSEDVCRFLQSTIRMAGCKPKYIVSDKGIQFWCEHFKNWCRRHGIRPRFGAVGRYGSVALIERFLRSLKTECTRRILVPPRDRDFRHELALYVTWYNRYRPNQGLDGLVPFQLVDALSVSTTLNLRHPEVANSNIPKFELLVTSLEGRRHLPIIELRKAP
jgi:putative transposase